MIIVISLPNRNDIGQINNYRVNKKGKQSKQSEWFDGNNISIHTALELKNEKIKLEQIDRN